MTFLEKLNQLGLSRLNSLNVFISDVKIDDKAGKVIYYMAPDGIFVLGNIIDSKFITKNSDKFDYINNLIDERLNSESLFF